MKTSYVMLFSCILLTSVNADDFSARKKHVADLQKKALVCSDLADKQYMEYEAAPVVDEKTVNLPGEPGRPATVVLA